MINFDVKNFGNKKSSCVLPKSLLSNDKKNLSDKNHEVWNFNFNL